MMKNRKLIVMAIAIVMTIGMMLAGCGSQQDPANDYEYEPEIEEAMVDIPESADAYAPVTAAELEGLYTGDPKSMYDYWNQYLAISTYIAGSGGEEGNIGDDLELFYGPYEEDAEALASGSYQLATDEAIAQYKEIKDPAKVTVYGKLVTVTKEAGYIVYVTGIVPEN